jgi:C-terminal processing protease CtpA/Prc
VGGTEEGSQVCIGHIVKDGPADRDPRIQTGDEIVNINGVNVVSEIKF